MKTTTGLANSQSVLPVVGGNESSPSTGAADPGASAENRSHEPEFTAPDGEDDDLAWARPRPSASTRLKATAAVLALLFAATIGFAAGTKYGRSHAPTSVGRNGFGRGGFGAGGFGGGFGGAGAAVPGGGTGGAGAADAAGGGAATATTPPTSPDLGGLLPK